MYNNYFDSITNINDSKLTKGNFSPFNTINLKNTDNQHKDEIRRGIKDTSQVPFLLFEEPSDTFKSYDKAAIKGLHIDNDISKKFFSEDNIKKVQNKIKISVLKRTMGKIILNTDQDRNSVMIVMRAVYFQYGKYMPDNVDLQIKTLNSKVISEIMPDIITNIKQYYGYISDISKPIEPIDRPVNLSSTGLRTLPALTSVYEFP